MFGTLVAAWLPMTASAQLLPGDLLASTLDPYGAGTVVIVTDGGNVAEDEPFVTLADGVSATQMCVTGEGRVLLANFHTRELTGTVLDITSGVPEVFASGFSAPFGLYCAEGEILLADFYRGVFDITAGGDFAATEPFADIDIPVSIMRDSEGTLWTGSWGGRGGVYDVSGGGDFTLAEPYLDDPRRRTSWFAELDGSLLTYHFGRSVLDFTAGGSVDSAPVFATLPNMAGMVQLGSTLYASTFDRAIYDITEGGDFSEAEPFAIGLPGFVYGMAAIPECGNGELEPGEACDDGNQVGNDGCNAQCRPTRIGRALH
jgi:cysteine-rich repeat protein